MPSLSVGLIGYGYSGQTFHAPVLSTIPDLRLAAIVTSQPNKAATDWPEATLYNKVEDLLSDEAIDLVVVASPNTLHFDHARRALEAGKHVVLEKPVTLDSRMAGDLTRLARAQGLIYCPFHNRRWDGDFLTVRRILAEALLGEVHSFESRIDRYRPQVRDRWRERDLPGSGLLYDLGPHLVDQVLVLFGPPVTLWAQIRRLRYGSPVDDDFLLVLGYPGRRVVLGASMVIRAPGPRFTIHGDRGSFVKYGMDPQEEALKAGGRPDGPEWGADDPSRYGLLSGAAEGSAYGIPTETGQYQAFYQKLATAIIQGGDPPVPATAGRDSLWAIELALESERSGRCLAWEA
ncbi:MAG: oxidoreductase [Candidatus Competibacteraceae bacterium]|nr:oxidoreductase [Candidatus Competibacteraceae bacterium]